MEKIKAQAKYTRKCLSCYVTYETEYPESSFLANSLCDDCFEVYDDWLEQQGHVIEDAVLRWIKQKRIRESINVWKK